CQATYVTPALPPWTTRRRTRTPRGASTLSLHDALPIFVAPQFFDASFVARLRSRLLESDAAGFFSAAAIGHGMQRVARADVRGRSEEHTSELQSLAYLVCGLLLEKKKNAKRPATLYRPP